MLRSSLFIQRPLEVSVVVDEHLSELLEELARGAVIAGADGFVEAILALAAVRLRSRRCGALTGG